MAHDNPLRSYHESRTIESYVALLMAAGEVKRPMAEKIAETYPMGTGLATANTVDLERVGLTKKQAVRLEAMLHLCRYLAADPYRSTLTGPEEVVRYLRHELRDQEQESFVAVLLDARGKVIDVREVFRGSAAHVEVHPRELFRDAIRLRAHSIIVAHNHPSGEPDPSQADIELTRRIKDVGRLVGIPLLDHVVIGRDRSQSLATMGLV